MDRDEVSPRLEWTPDGAPVSGRFGDVYFSREDGLAETRAVFLQGCGVPDAWAGRRRFVVGELGFGTGLNIAALLDLWCRTHEPGARLHVFSVEGYPLTSAEAARALSAWPELEATTQALLNAWPAATPGFHRIDLPDLNAVVDVAVGDAAWALSRWTGRADAWFLDGFAPSANPQMWSPEVFDALAARSAPGARVATFTVAGVVRRAMVERGFVVDKRPGHGRKRERLEARMAGEVAEPPLPRVAVIGAGIAGASVVRALIDAGAEVIVVEADTPGAGGSGFPSALVTPRLDAGDAGIAALYAQAQKRAGALYGAVEGAVLARGVLQLAQAPRDAGRFAKVAAQPIWADSAMTALDAQAATARLGEPTDAAALDMADALAIRPQAVLDAWLAGATILTGTVSHIQRADGRWRLADADGGVLVEADAVVLAGGWGTAALAPELRLSPVRGQADWVEGPSTAPVAWGGYATPTPDGLLFGATHDRDDTTTEPRPADSVRNLATLAARLPGLADRVEAADARRSRAAVRATTPDRLPLAGAAPDQPGLFVLSGLGSRGFCVAPLLGEHLAALILGLPSPLPSDLASRVDPARGRERTSAPLR